MALLRVRRRRGKEVLARIAAPELRSLFETAHLTASPANARQLTRALRDAKAGRNMTLMSAKALRGWTALPSPGKRVRRPKP